MKRVLIISPYFSPSNTPDMQRVRMSAPYFKENGWDAEIVTVNPIFSEAPKDELLLESLPEDIKVHQVEAFNKSFTSRLGFGNIAYRSYWYYRKKVNQLLSSQRYDLIYFSTTAFPICVLGAYWKKRFGVPYVIDMQDPWHSDYYQDKPKEQQPPKYWLSYRMNRVLEPMALKNVSGLITVSENYVTELKARYPQIANVPFATITFGYYAPDIDIAKNNAGRFTSLLAPASKNIVYVGRGGMDMHQAISPFFQVFKQALAAKPELYKRIRFNFIGTSYAEKGQGSSTILPLAKKFGIAGFVNEITDRIPYYEALATLQQADALFIPGSDDPKYTASKIYPYLLTNKPLFSIFNYKSPANEILNDCQAPYTLSYNSPDIKSRITLFLESLATNTLQKPVYDLASLQQYNAKNLTKRQTEVFDEVLRSINNNGNATI